MRLHSMGPCVAMCGEYRATSGVMRSQLFARAFPTFVVCDTNSALFIAISGQADIRWQAFR